MSSQGSTAAQQQQTQPQPQPQANPSATAPPAISGATTTTGAVGAQAFNSASSSLSDSSMHNFPYTFNVDYSYQGTGPGAAAAAATGTTGVNGGANNSGAIPQGLGNIGALPNAAFSGQMNNLASFGNQPYDALSSFNNVLFDADEAIPPNATLRARRSSSKLFSMPNSAPTTADTRHISSSLPEANPFASPFEINSRIWENTEQGNTQAAAQPQSMQSNQSASRFQFAQAPAPSLGAPGSTDPSGAVPNDSRRKSVPMAELPRLTSPSMLSAIPDSSAPTGSLPFSADGATLSTFPLSGASRFKIGAFRRASFGEAVSFDSSPVGKSIWSDHRSSAGSMQATSPILTIPRLSGDSGSPKNNGTRFRGGAPPNAPAMDYVKSFDNPYGSQQMEQKKREERLLHRFSNMDLSNGGDQYAEAYEEANRYFKSPPAETLRLSQALSYLNTPQLPNFSGGGMSGVQLLLVCFKGSRLDTFYIPTELQQTMQNLKLGDLIIVQADRGRDLGKVVQLDVTLLEARLLKMKQYRDQQAALNQDTSSGNGSDKRSTLHFPKAIVRFAYPNEVAQLMVKKTDEDKAKNVCQLKVKSHGLVMNITDSEYQWDRRKLTFYYKSNKRIDFRELVKELFKIYKTRIWMCKQPEPIAGFKHGL